MQLETVRKRLEVSGFELDDEAILEIGPWIRWSTSFCALFALLGTSLASPSILWALALTALGGSVLPNHPFDYVYNYGVRRMTKTRPLPPNPPPRKFACYVATPWLIATGLAFFLGASALGYALGLSFASVAVLVSLTHICIPSIIYNAIFAPKRSEATTPS